MLKLLSFWRHKTKPKLFRRKNDWTIVTNEKILYLYMSVYVLNTQSFTDCLWRNSGCKLPGWYCHRWCLTHGWPLSSFVYDDSFYLIQWWRKAGYEIYLRNVYKQKVQNKYFIRIYITFILLLLAVVRLSNWQLPPTWLLTNWLTAYFKI